MIGQSTKLDVSLAAIGVPAGLILLIIATVYVPYQSGLAITLLVTAGGYLLMRKPLAASQGIQDAVGDEAQRQAWVVRMITGCVLVLSVLIVGVSYNSLGRPYWIILLLSVIPVCILFQALFLSRISKELEMLLFLQIVFLLTAIVLSAVYAFPFSGGDTWSHTYNASVIADSGTVRAIPGAYRNYPFYPAVVTAVSELVGLDFQQVARLESLVGALIGLLALYGLARIYYTAAQSLILALLLVGSKWFIYWTTNIVSMADSLWFFCLFVAIVLKRFSTTLRATAVFTLIILAVAVPFFHPIGAMAVIMLLGGSVILDTVRSDRKDLQWRRSLVGLSVLTAVVTLTQWMYYGTTFETALRSLANTILGFDQLQLGSSYRDVTVYNLDQLNLFMLFSLAALGTLKELRLRHSEIDIYTGLIGFGFVLFGYMTQVLVIKTLVGHRWLLFASLLLVFPASSALFVLIRHRSIIARVLLLGALACYFLLGLGSSETNRDSPLYGKDFTGLLEATSSEYAGLLYLRGLKDKGLTTDASLCHYLKLYIPASRLNCWGQVDFAQVGGLFTFRDAYLDRRMLVGKNLTSEDLRFQEEGNVVLLYDSGDLKVFERVSASNNDSD